MIPAGFVAFIAANIQDTSGNKLAAGTLEVLPTDGNDNPITAAAGGGTEVSFTGTTTSGSSSVTSVSSTAGLAVGQAVTGAGVAAGTTISAIGSGTITLSNNASATASGVALLAMSGQPGQMLSQNPAVFTVSTGALPAGAQIADTTQTLPPNISYRMTVKDSTGLPVLVLKGVQTQANTTFNLDTFQPNVAQQALVQYGPPGPPTNLAVTTTTLSAGSNATATISGTPPNQTLALGIPTGPQGPQGPVGGALGATPGAAPTTGGFVGTSTSSARADHAHPTLAAIGSTYRDLEVADLPVNNEYGLSSARTDQFGFIISGAFANGQPYPSVRLLPLGSINTGTLVQMPVGIRVRDAEVVDLPPNNEYGFSSARTDQFGFVISGVLVSGQPYPTTRLLPLGSINSSVLVQMPPGIRIRDLEITDLAVNNEYGLASAKTDQFGFIISGTLAAGATAWQGPTPSSSTAAVAQVSADQFAFETRPMVYTGVDGSSNQQVFLAENGVQTQLTSVGVNTNPVLSSDSNRVAYLRTVSGASAPYIMTRYGRNQRPIATDVPGLFGLNGFFQTGQSLSVGARGYGTGAYASTPIAQIATQPFENVMFNGGVVPNGVHQSGNYADRMASLVPLIEQAGIVDSETGDNSLFGETGMAASMNNVTQAGLYAGRDLKMLIGGFGITGAASGAIQKGASDYSYSNGQSMISNAITLASAASLSFGVRGLTIIHGEADESNNNAAYAAWLATMQSNFETDSMALTGQTLNIPMFLVQMCSGFSLGPGATTPHRPIIAQQQMQAALSNPGKIYNIGPAYWAQYNLPDIHHNAAGYVQVGELFAKVMYQVCFQQKEWKPLQPKMRDDGTPAIVRDGKFIYIDFDVPSGPLVFDTVNVTADPYIPGSKYGFVYEDSNGTGTSAPVISSATINGNTVVLQLASTPTGTSKRLSYALLGNPVNGAGPTSGARGNLRDSDPYVGMYGTKAFNWACVMDYPIT